MQNLGICYVRKPDAAKVACPVWRGLGGNVLRKVQRAALPPYATQLLNAGCRITSIQAFLGHKKLNTTMIYARAHDQTVADDYFAAMKRVELRLDPIPPEPEPEEIPNADAAPEHTQVFTWLEQLAQPELDFPARLEIAAALRQALAITLAHSPPMAVLA